MPYKSLHTILGLLLLNGFFGCAQQVENDSDLSNGLKENIIRLPKEICSHKVESSVTFTPDGQTLFFARKDSFYSYRQKSIIYVSSIENGIWSTPEVAWFSGVFSDSSPFVSPDGTKIYYASDRPIRGNDTKRDKDIWVISIENGAWGQPSHVAVYNSSESEYSPTTDADGNLYFGSYRSGGNGSGDIWVSYLRDGEFQEPENLGTQINTRGGEWGSCVSPEGDYLIYEASGREENITNDGDLFISFNENGQWTNTIHLGELNSGGSDLSPKIQNGHLYFASNRHEDFQIQMSNNNVDLYKIKLETLFAYFSQLKNTK